VALASHEPSALRRQAGRLLRAPARPPPLPVGGRVETTSGAVVFKVKGICCFDRWPAAVRIILFAASPTCCAITAFVGNACAFHRALAGECCRHAVEAYRQGAPPVTGVARALPQHLTYGEGSGCCLE